MFKGLLQFWKAQDFLKKELKDFEEMLNDAEIMFSLVSKELIYNETEKGLKDKIYTIDKKVNELEKNIRRHAVQHLVVQPSVDITMCLLLMSVVKDAERLGDYSKNLYEIIEMTDKPIDMNKYQVLFDGIDKEILDLFTQTKTAFIDSDEEKAKKAWSAERDIVKKSDQIIKKLAESNLSVNEAVCFTLMARYFKRLGAHLANIATSVILPVSDLDYYDEKNID